VEEARRSVEISRLLSVKIMMKISSLLSTHLDTNSFASLEDEFLLQMSSLEVRRKNSTIINILPGVF